MDERIPTRISELNVEPDPKPLHTYDMSVKFNEYTNVNAIAKYAYRHWIIPFEKFNVEEIRTREMPRQNTLSPEEYKVC